MVGQQTKDRGKTSPAIMCIKILLHIFNLIYLILGACVLAVGIWTKVQLSDYFKLTGLYYDQAPYIMIGVGVLIMLVAFGGFYCTAKDKIALLYMYAIFIIILAVCQLAAGIAGGVMRNKLTEKFKSGLKDSLSKGNIKTWDTVQQNLQCCGVEKPDDWLAVNDNKLPASCWSDNTQHPYTPGNSTTATRSNATTTAAKPTTTPGTNTTTTAAPGTTTKSATTTTAQAPTTTNSTTTTSATTPTAPPTTTKEPKQRKRRAAEEGGGVLYTEGCASKIENAMNHSLGVIVGVCVGFVFLQVLGAVFACCLAKKTSKNNYEQIY